MVRYDISFLLLAVVCLIAGLTLGIGMGIAHDFQLMPVHAHLNLVGFVMLSIFGLTYRAYPALARSRLAGLHLFLSVIGAIVFPIGIYFSIVHNFPFIAIGGSFIVFGGVATFLANLILNVVRSSPAVAGTGKELPQAA
jgi:uncharacterized membrane protein